MYDNFIFDDPRYAAIAKELRSAYACASPFPHAVIDEFLPEPVAERLLIEFPKPEDADWLQYRYSMTEKLFLSSESRIRPYARRVLHEFNSGLCLEFLQALTGIDGLIPDPYLEGGGLHQIESGGWLKVHADFNRHMRLKLDRRINLLFYLNKHWADEYGGQLELWDREMKACVKKIAPIFNRCVIFSTTDTAYHGHPEPLKCPVGTSRKSFALYYYSNGRPLDEVSDLHSTLWRARPGEQLERGPCPPAQPRQKALVRRIVKALTPPVIWNGLSLVRDRLFPPGRDESA